MAMNGQKTAIEWLLIAYTQGGDFYECIRTAKKMETDQLINAYIAGAGEVDEADMIMMRMYFELFPNYGKYSYV